MSALPRLLSTGLRCNAGATCGCPGRRERGLHELADLPDTMRAMGFDQPGPPGVLREERHPMPVPAAGQVLIRVAYAGVNRPDVIQRQGFYPAPPGASCWRATCPAR